MHVRMTIRELFTATATIQQIKMGSDIQRAFCALHLLLLLLLLLSLMLLLHWIIQNQRVDDDECQTHLLMVPNPIFHLFHYVEAISTNYESGSSSNSSSRFFVFQSAPFKIDTKFRVESHTKYLRLKLKSISNLLLA